MKKTMRVLMSSMAAIILMTSFSTSAIATSREEEIGDRGPTIVIIEDEGSRSPRVEETEWVRRYNRSGSYFEKRLWSCTYKKWKTDWIKC